MTDITIICLKPDALQRGITGEIISMFEKKGFKICSIKTVLLKEETLYKLYPGLKDKDYHQQVKSMMLSSPCIMMILSGNNAIKAVRLLAGETREPENAPAWTVRGKFSLWTGCDVIHSASSKEEAEKQINLFFHSDEIYEYKRLDEKFMSEDAWNQFHSENKIE